MNKKLLHTLQQMEMRVKFSSAVEERGEREVSNLSPVHFSYGDAVNSDSSVLPRLPVLISSIL